MSKKIGFRTSHDREHYISNLIIKKLSKAGIKDNHIIKYGYSLCVGEYVRIEACGYTQYANGFDAEQFENAIDNAIEEITRRFIDEFTSGSSGG